MATTVRGTGIKAQNRRLDGQDTGWCWVVAVAASVVLFCVMWTSRCSGVLFVSVINVFGVSREEATWPIILFNVFTSLAGPVAATLGHTFQPRQVILIGTLLGSVSVFLCQYATSTTTLAIFLGVIQGVCCGTAFSLVPVLVNSHFKKHATSATGIVFAGPAIASFVLPRLLEYVQQKYGFRGSFAIFSGIVLNAIPAVLLLKSPTSSKAPCCLQANSARSSISDNESQICASESQCTEVLVVPNKIDTIVGQTGSVQILKPDHFKTITEESLIPRICRKLREVFSRPLMVLSKLMFYLITFSYLVFVYNNTTFSSIIIDFAHDKKIDLDKAVFLLSSFGAGDLFGRLGTGWFTDHGILRKRDMIVFTFLVFGSLMQCFPSADSFEVVITLSAVAGVANGSTLILFPGLLKEYIGHDLWATAYGWQYFFAGLSLLGRPYISGHLRDITGTYDALFHILGSTSILVSFLWTVRLVYDFIKHRMTSDDSESDISDNEDNESTDSSDLERTLSVISLQQ